MKKVHEDELPYKCDKCDRAFKKRGELSGHVKESHSGDRVKCEVCLVKFSSAMQLRQHICTKRERKLKCGSCGDKFFTRMADLIHHARFCK